MGRGLLAAVAALAATFGSTSAARAADHPVSFPTGVAGAPYTPSSVTAGVGDTVTFSGAFASHPLVWDDGDYATRSTGTSGAYTLTRPGTFRFHCQIHYATMTGTVTVPGNQTATPSFTFVVDDRTVAFTASGTDPDGTIARFEWDLDGDGSYETTGATPSKTYTSSGTYNVHLRYVDDAHETSPVATRAVAIAAGGTTTPPPPPTGGGTGGGGAGGGSGGGGGGTTPGSPSPSSGGSGGSPTDPSTSPAGGGQGTDDTGSPGLRVLSTALAFRHGRATLRLRLAETATSARVRLSRSGTTLATGSASRLRAGTRTVTLKLSRAGVRALRSGKKLRATLAVTLRAGGAAETTRAAVTLRRASG
jgi:plastocyanin